MANFEVFEANKTFKQKEVMSLKMSFSYDVLLGGEGTVTNRTAPNPLMQC